MDQPPPPPPCPRLPGPAPLSPQVSLGGMFLASVQPLAYELAIEATYPIPEEVSGTVLVIMYNLGALIAMTAAQLIPATVINWLLAGSCALCGLTMVFFEGEYKRSDVDAGAQAGAQVGGRWPQARVAKADAGA